MLERRAFVMSVLVPLSAACGGGSPAAPRTVPANAPGTQVPNEGWSHVPEGASVTYQNNPPASGPHYPVWARYEEHASVIARSYWVHNLEHGAIVLLYRPDAPAATIAALRDAYRTIPADPACGHKRALLTADPQLPLPIAAVAADWVLTGDSVDSDAILAFTSARRGRGPEAVCADGSRP